MAVGEKVAVGRSGVVLALSFDRPFDYRFGLALALAMGMRAVLCLYACLLLGWACLDLIGIVEVSSMNLTCSLALYGEHLTEALLVNAIVWAAGLGSLPWSFSLPPPRP